MVSLDRPLNDALFRAPSELFAEGSVPHLTTNGRAQRVRAQPQARIPELSVVKHYLHDGARRVGDEWDADARRVGTVVVRALARGRMLFHRGGAIGSGGGRTVLRTLGPDLCDLVGWFQFFFLRGTEGWANAVSGGSASDGARSATEQGAREKSNPKRGARVDFARQRTLPRTSPAWSSCAPRNPADASRGPPFCSPGTW